MKFFFLSVEETMVKRIIWQTLQAVHFCHQNNVSTVLYYKLNNIKYLVIMDVLQMRYSCFRDYESKAAFRGRL